MFRVARQLVRLWVSEVAKVIQDPDGLGFRFRV